MMQVNALLNASMLDSLSCKNEIKLDHVVKCIVPDMMTSQLPFPLHEAMLILWCVQIVLMC